MRGPPPRCGLRAPRPPYALRTIALLSLSVSGFAANGYRARNALPGKRARPYDRPLGRNASALTRLAKEGGRWIILL